MNATVGQKDYFDWTDALTRAEARLSKMSHEDKVAIALHDYAAVDAEEIIVFDYADGPNGIRGHIGATAFPSALALASTFDRGTATAYGIALAHETLAAGRNAVFSPGLDIVLVPKGGRAGQQLGEDPLLAGEIGGSVGQVIQTQGVLAVATHYVANNFEWLRTGSGSVGRRGDAIDVHVSDRALHEIYLEPFRRALGKYGVAAFMGSYNRLNGEYVCQRHDLLSLPRRLWQWAGVCVPDYLWAVRDAGVALHAGLDLPSLGDAGGRTAEQVAELGEQRLNDLVLHVLTASERVGLAPPSPGSSSAPRRWRVDAGSTRCGGFRPRRSGWAPGSCSARGPWTTAPRWPTCRDGRADWRDPRPGTGPRPSGPRHTSVDVGGRTAGLVGAGLAVTTLAGVRVEEQFTIVGVSGALTFSALCGLLLHWLLALPGDRAAAGTPQRLLQCRVEFPWSSGGGCATPSPESPGE